MPPRESIFCSAIFSTLHYKKNCLETQIPNQQLPLGVQMSHKGVISLYIV